MGRVCCGLKGVGWRFQWSLESWVCAGRYRLMLEEILHLTIRVPLLCQGMSSPSHSASLTPERDASHLKVPLRAEGPSPVSSGEHGLWGWTLALACTVREEDEKSKRIGRHGSKSLFLQIGIIVRAHPLSLL